VNATQRTYKIDILLVLSDFGAQISVLALSAVHRHVYGTGSPGTTVASLAPINWAALYQCDHTGFI
jgi:hypothetical protein